MSSRASRKGMFCTANGRLHPAGGADVALLRAGAVVRLVRPRETPMDAVRIRGDADKSISELCALSDSF